MSVANRITITAIQIRAARAGLRMSLEKVAELTEISSRTIRRMESSPCLEIPGSTNLHLRVLKEFFERKGVEFSSDGQSIRFNQAIVVSNDDNTSPNNSEEVA
jgi:transcriptional regulator with XRE-family HTH domain